MHVALLCAGGLAAVTALTMAVSPRARREIGKHAKRGIGTIKDDETRRSEQVVLVLALLLVASGSIVPGPLDEIIGIAVIARVVQRVDKRKKGQHV